MLQVRVLVRKNKGHWVIPSLSFTHFLHRSFIGMVYPINVPMFWPEGVPHPSVLHMTGTMGKLVEEYYDNVSPSMLTKSEAETLSGFVTMVHSFVYNSARDIAEDERKDLWLEVVVEEVQTQFWYRSPMRTWGRRKKEVASYRPWVE